MPRFLSLDLLFPLFLMLDLHASMSHTMCLCLDLSFPCVVWLDPHVSMLVYMFICLSYMLYALCFMSCLDPSFLCVDVSIYMLTCLISCLWLCLA